MYRYGDYMKSMLFAFFIALFYAIGLGLLGYAMWSAHRSNIAAAWPIALGTMESCSLESRSDGEGGTTYEVKVQYSYAVNRKEFRGSRLAFGYAGSSGHEAHQQILSKLKSSKIVDVRYDPADPSVSTLSFGIHRSILFMFAFAITWLAFVVGLTVIWWVASRGDDVLLRNLGVG